MTSSLNFLHFDGDVWEKKEDPSFDITMGSFDGAEVCKLVGMYLQNEIINSKIGVTKEKSGLYRDDGLILIQASKRELDNIRKKLEALLATHDLKITAETGLSITENTYKP